MHSMIFYDKSLTVQTHWIPVDGNRRKKTSNSQWSREDSKAVKSLLLKYYWNFLKGFRVFNALLCVIHITCIFILYVRTFFYLIYYLYILLIYIYIHRKLSHFIWLLSDLPKGCVEDTAFSEKTGHSTCTFLKLVPTLYNSLVNTIKFILYCIVNLLYVQI